MRDSVAVVGNNTNPPWVAIGNDRPDDLHRPLASGGSPTYDADQTYVSSARCWTRAHRLHATTRRVGGRKDSL